MVVSVTIVAHIDKTFLCIFDRNIMYMNLALARDYRISAIYLWDSALFSFWGPSVVDLCLVFSSYRGGRCRLRSWAGHHGLFLIFSFPCRKVSFIWNPSARMRLDPTPSCFSCSCSIIIDQCQRWWPWLFHLLIPCCRPKMKNNVFQPTWLFTAKNCRQISCQARQI